MTTNTYRRSGLLGLNIDLMIDLVDQTSVKLRGGPLTYKGTAYAIEDTNVTMQPSEDRQTILMYLMKSKTTDEIELHIDEVGPLDVPMTMDTDPDFDYIVQVGSLSIPAGDQNLDNAILNVYMFIDPMENQHEAS